MKRFLLLSLFAVPLFVTACQAPTETTEPEEETQESSAPALDAEDLVTKNVTYTGILEQGGVTIYQEGSHRLMLSDGKMVLLNSAEGASVSLDLYIGKLVRVKGDVMPTVEAGGTIMDVKEIHWIRREEDEDGNEQEVMRVLCGGESGVRCPEGTTCVLQEQGPGICMEQSEESSSSEGSSVTSSTSSSEVSSTSSAASSSPSSSPSSTSPSSTSSSVSSSASVSSTGNSNYDRALELMIKEEYAADRWTQEYCTDHVNFCVPVHKNWYFKSFGAMTSILWHVEMGAVDVGAMGDGPIVVELKSGDLSAMGGGDGDIKVIGGKVIGYRSHSDNRHFEISAPSSLQTAVTFVAKGLKITAE